MATWQTKSLQAVNIKQFDDVKTLVMGLEQAIADVPHDERVAELFTPYLGVRFVKDDNNYFWAPDTESELLWFGVRGMRIK